MKCSLCKRGERKDETVTLTLERGKTTLVIKDVPARVCDQCGDEVFSEEVTRRTFDMLKDSVRRGVQVEVTSFAPAREPEPART